MFLKWQQKLVLLKSYFTVTLYILKYIWFQDTKLLRKIIMPNDPQDVLHVVISHSYLNLELASLFYKH